MNGSQLTTDDLLNLSKGQCLIRVKLKEIKM